MFHQEGNKLIANRNFIAFIVYISLLLDNILLTVIGKCVCVSERWTAK